MLNVESIGPLQDEDSITLDNSKIFGEESPQFPFLINSIYCYNTKENMNKATEKDNKQEPSKSSSESGGILGFLNNLRAGCSPFANRRNSDDDSAQNNKNKSSPQQQKSPIKSSGNYEPSQNQDERYGSQDERYGSLGKEGLQKLNEQRELDRLRKKSQQPTKTMTPIEKQREEQEKLKQDRAGKGKPLDVSNAGPAKKLKSDNKDNQVQKPDASNFPEDKKLKSAPVDGGKDSSQIPNKELSPNVSNIGKAREMKGKDKEGEKRPGMNKSDVQQPTNEMPPDTKHQLKPSNDDPLKERKKPDQSASNLTPDGGKAEMRKNASTPIQQSSPAGTIPAKENQLQQDNDKMPPDRKNQLKPSNDEGPLKERKKPDQSASNLTPDGEKAEMRKNASTPIQQSSPAGTIPAKENQLKQDNDKKSSEEKEKVDKLASNLSPDANQTAEKRNDITKPIQEPSQADRMQNQQSGQPNRQIIPADTLAKTNKLGQDSPIQLPQDEAKKDKNKSDKPIKPKSTVGETSGQTNESNRLTTIPVAVGENELNSIKENERAKKDADGMPSNKSAEPQNEKQPKMQKANDSDLSERPERPRRKSGELSMIKNDKKKQDKPAKDTRKVDKLGGDVSEPVADSGTTEGGKVKESPVQPSSEMSNVQGKRDPINATTPAKKYQSQPIKDDENSQKVVGKMPSDKAEGQPRDNLKGPQTQPKSGIDKSDLDRRPESAKKETDDSSKVGQKKQEKPVKEDPTKGGLESMSKVPPLPVSPAANEKDIPSSMKGAVDPNRREKPVVYDIESPMSFSPPGSTRSSLNVTSHETLTQEPSAVDDKGKTESRREKPAPKKRKLADNNAFPYDPEIIREKLKNQIKSLREEGFYTDSEFDDMDDEIYQTVMSYGAQSNVGKMSITSESSLSLPSLSTLSFGSSNGNVVKDLWTSLRKRSRSELNMVVRPVKRNKDRPVVPTGKMTTIGEAQYVDYESTAFDLNLPTKFKVSTEEVESTLLMNFDPERKAMSGDKCFRLYQNAERGHQISIPINDLQIPVFVYETDNDPEGILVTDQVIRSKLQVCLEVASMYYDEISVNRGRLLVHLAEYAPNSVIGFLRQLAEAIVNRRINSKPKINGFLNKVHEMSSADRTILKKDLGDKPELDNFRLLSRLKTKVFSEFYRRVGYWELVEGEKEVNHKHLFLIRHMPRLYKTGLYPFIDFISEYIANNQIRTLDQLEVALIRFLVCSDGVITKSEFNTFCDFGLKKKC